MKSWISFLAITLTTPLALAAPDARKMVDQAENGHRLENLSERYQVRMVLQNQGNEPRNRDYDMIRLQDDKNGDKVRVHFTGPANIRGTALLTLENRKKGRRTADDDQWLYLSAFKKTRRVGAAELGDRFMTSDIFYEDLKRRHVGDYAYTFVREEALDGQPTVVVEARPHDARVKEQSPYGKTMLWIRKDISFIVKMRHFDKRDEPLKEIQFLDIVPVKEKIHRSNRIVVTDVQRKHRTTLVVRDRKLVKDVGKDTFSSSALKALSD